MTRAETLKALRTEEAALRLRVAETGNLVAAANKEGNQGNIRYIEAVWTQMRRDLDDLVRRIKEVEAQAE